MKKASILFVDDEKDVLDAFQVGLTDRGYEIVTASSGAEALDLLKSYTPDLIIADLRMQPMNGFDLFQEVKKIEKHMGIPFFFLTAVDDVLAQKYGQKLGVDLYITKPVDLDNLDTAIKNKLSES
ncbi:MAG TPA: response regulator [Bacteroidota bacterium]|nr:response regulator [Bacteroidota bacterium]